MISHFKQNTLLALALAAGAVGIKTATAEETGSGHYAPGATVSFFDTLPAKPGLAVANYFMYYDGHASATLPFSGKLTLDAQAQAYSDSLMVMYETNWKLLGGHYVSAVGIPYIWLDVEGKITGPLGPIAVCDRANGIGDILIYPFMLGWAKGDFKYDLRFGANAFCYQQFSGDSGSGAVLGDLAGRTVGVGPVLSYITMLGKNTLATEIKWLPELDTKNRLKGDYVWFKLGMTF